MLRGAITEEVSNLLRLDLSTPDPKVILSEDLIDFVFHKALENAGDNESDKESAESTMPAPGETTSLFFSSSRPTIPLNDFLARLRLYAKCSDGVFLWALVLLQRLEYADRRLRVSPFNIHRLLITAIMISAKFVDNAWYSNKYYARVGGVASVEEMNNLELEMLKLLDFRVHVPLSELLHFCYKHAASAVRVGQPRFARM